MDDDLFARVCAAIGCAPLKPHDRGVLLSLVSMCDRDWCLYGGVRAIAQRCGASKAGFLAAIVELRARGIVSRETVSTTSTRWLLDPDRIAALRGRSSLVESRQRSAAGIPGAFVDVDVVVGRRGIELTVGVTERRNRTSGKRCVDSRAEA